MGDEQPTVSFRALGPLTVTRGDVPVDLGGPRQRSVLAHLLIEANRVVSLDRLIDSLWADQPPRTATGSLQAYISNLRRALEPEQAAGARSGVLATAAPGYMLCVDRRSWDAAIFEDELRDARLALQEARPSAALETVERALGLWRGPAFAEFSGEAFARAESSRLEELRWIALETRIEATLALGDHAAQIAQIEALLDADPMREGLWGSLLVALYRSGRQADAVAAYQRARDALAEELGLDPSPALRRMYEQILRQDPELDLVRTEHERVTLASEATTSSAAPSDVPFMGRTADVRVLRDGIARARDGHAGIALVAGEAGIGKTRLVQEATRDAASNGPTVAWGRCHEGEGAPPLWPWSQVIRTIVPDVDAIPDAVRVLVEPVRDAAGHAFQDRSARGHLYEAITRFLFSLASSRPLVLVLDDLQWADTPTQEMLAFLSEELVGNERIFLIGTYRDTDVGPRHPLADTLAVLARVGVTRISLQGLEEGDVRAMLEPLGERDGDPALARTVHTRTGGNPFFIGELVRLIRSRDDEGIGEALGKGVPSGVHDIVRRRLARLPEAATSILTIAAVDGREVDHAMLRAVEGVEEGALLDVIDAAVMTSLLEEGADGRLRFAHDIVRESLLRQISGPRRARVHAMLARAAEHIGRTGDEGALKTAAHAWQGADGLGAERALPLVLAGVDAALSRYAYEAAAELLRRALDLAGRAEPGPERDEGELVLQVRLGNVLARCEGYGSAEAGRAFARASRLAASVDAHVAVPALWGTWAYHYVRGELREVEAIGRRLESQGEATDDHDALAVANEALGIAAVHRGDVETALTRLEAAVRLADATIPSRPKATLLQDQRISARGFYAVALVSADRFEESRAVLDEMRALSAMDDYSATISLTWEAWVAVYAGDRAAAAPPAAELVRRSREHGVRLWEGFGHVFYGWSVASASDIEHGIALIEGTGARYSATMFYELLAEVYDAEGRASDAARAREIVETRAIETGERLLPRSLRR